MSWLRKHLGLDGFALLIHVGVTVMLIAWVDMDNGPEQLYPVIMMGSLIVLGIRRAIVLGLDRKRGLTTGEMEAERIADLEQRMAELEMAQARVAELEDRLDFTERMLASVQSEQAARLPRAGEH